MYQTPDLSDFERNLRKIIADGEKEAHADRLRISTAMITGANLGGSRVTIAIIKEFDRIHDRTLELAMHLIRDFAQRSELTIMALIDTARPLLDNFAEKLFKQLPDFLASKNRIRDEYRGKFQERLDGALRDISVGFVGGRSVAAQQDVGTTTTKMSDALLAHTAEPRQQDESAAEPGVDTPIYRTGVVGKPTSWHLVKAECRRRWDAGERHPNEATGAESPAEWSRVLIDWLKSTHPEAPALTQKALANRLSGFLRELQDTARPKS